MWSVEALTDGFPIKPLFKFWKMFFVVFFAFHHLDPGHTKILHALDS